MTQPSVYSVSEGFPDIASWNLHRHIVSDAHGAFSRTISLVFNKVSGSEARLGKAQLNRLYVYLINSRFGVADFEFTEDFPPLVSYHIEDIEDGISTKRVMKIVVFEFEKGSLSFVFDKAFHALTSCPIGKS